MEEKSIKKYFHVNADIKYHEVTGIHNKALNEDKSKISIIISSEKYCRQEVN